MNRAKQSAFARVVDQFEETLIAFLLGAMTLITFANVIARYVFNSNILWAVESTVYLFAWLVLLGVAYGIKHNFHIGVDVVVKMFPRRVQKILTLVAAGACILFALLLLKGSWDYWAPFIGNRAFLEVEDIPMPGFLQFIADILNDGERYEKMPRFIPYFVLPLSMALITWRFIQAAWRVWNGQDDLLIASHEAEEMMEEAGYGPGSNGDDAEAKQ
ncbi:MAG: TRAP transporter small permease [Rhizobiaceae bacterium]|nr:TRAP transporter small permease [Rhizobiaceae bacterium]